MYKEAFPANVEPAQDVPNRDTPTGIVIARWSVIAMLLAFGVVYLTMLMTGFSSADSLWLAGMSSVPLAIAIVVGLLVWQFYWSPRIK